MPRGPFCRGARWQANRLFESQAWTLGHGLICHAPANYSGPCARQALGSVANVPWCKKKLTENGRCQWEVWLAMIKCSGCKKKQVVFFFVRCIRVRMLEYECGFSWPRGDVTCKRNYSSPCPYGGHASRNAALDYSRNARFLRMVGKSASRW